jgi:hypothetical protein
MRYLRGAVIGLSFAVALGFDVTGPESARSIAVGSSAFAQAEKGTVTGRVKRWTRARLEAAKKHWAEDQQRFSECTREWDDVKKKSARRMSYHRQGHFLEQCMRAKH